MSLWASLLIKNATRIFCKKTIVISIAFHKNVYISIIVIVSDSEIIPEMNQDKLKYFWNKRLLCRFTPRNDACPDVGQDLHVYRFL